MNVATLLLVLSSAALHSIWNLWTKQVRPAARGGSLAWLFTVISAVIYAPVAMVLFAANPWRPTSSALLWIAGSSVIHVVYFLVLLRGYRVGDLSVVYPTARGTGPLWAAAGGILLFGERATPLGACGALLVTAGVALLTWRARPAVGARDRTPGGGEPAGRGGAGLGWGILTGVLIGAYTLWDGWAVKRAGFPPLLYYWLGELMRVPLFTPLAWSDRQGVARVWREHRLRVLSIAALSPLSYILMLLALRDGSVSHVAPAREVSILFGAWLGGQVLAEHDRGWRLAAAGAFVAGVIALALA